MTGSVRKYSRSLTVGLSLAEISFVATFARRWNRTLVARATIHRVAAVATFVRAGPSRSHRRQTVDD
jgi:hypothetical protein